MSAVLISAVCDISWK